MQDSKVNKNLAKELGNSTSKFYFNQNEEKASPNHSGGMFDYSKTLVQSKKLKDKPEGMLNGNY